MKKIHISLPPSAILISILWQVTGISGNMDQAKRELHVKFSILPLGMERSAPKIQVLALPVSNRPV